MPKSYLARIAVIAGIGVGLAGAALSADRQDVARAHVEQWLASYESAWESRSADMAAALFTPDARYRDDPFKPAHEGREAIHAYWAGVTADQSAIDFTSSVEVVAGNTAVAPWHAEFTQTSTGAKIVLDGVFILKFAQGGLVSDLKEWWHIVVTPAEKK